MNFETTNVPFWSRDLRVLMNPSIIPLDGMTFEEKLNAISRLVILLSVLGLVLYKRILYMYIGVGGLGILFAFYVLSKKGNRELEGFDLRKLKKKIHDTREIIIDPQTLKTDLREDFYPTTSNNPFGNVLLTDIIDNPDKKAAAPAFNPDVSSSIHNAVKRQTQILNPDITNTNKQIYGDLWDKYNLDNSLLSFYSTANTRVTSDQGAFAEYLYGNMYSAKESGIEGDIMRVKDSYRYILN